MQVIRSSMSCRNELRRALKPYQKNDRSSACRASVSRSLPGEKVNKQSKTNQSDQIDFHFGIKEVCRSISIL
jgi:hypothetical protein